MAAKKANTSIQSRVFWLASLLFFTSGGTGLVYQVVWFKRFSHVWGSSSLAFAAVGASFLFGLGVGAYLLGRFADRVTIPLRWYGVCELLIGVLALVIPFEIAYLVDASVGLYAAIPDESFLRYLMQFTITVLVIGPPCMLMGGTLPLLIRQLTTRDGTIDQATGWLYAINTFGAAFGCYLTGFHFLPSLGLLWTNNLAAGVNIAIGLISLMVSKSAERLTVARSPSRTAVEQAPPTNWNLTLLGLFVATALSGSAALILEMTWTRQLSLVLGGSTYAFTATLFVVLVGIAIGSLIFHAFLRPVASNPWLPIAVVGMLLLGVLAGAWLMPTLAWQVGPQGVRDLRAGQFGNGLVCVTASAILELIPALGMGILFPLFVHLTHASAARVGAVVGNIYAWNTLGSIAGASLTSLLLFPTIGTAGSIALAAALYVVSLVAIIPWQGAANFGRVALSLGMGAVVVILLTLPTDPRLTNVGFYMYGQQKSFEEGDTWKTDNEILFFEEGSSSNVLVTNSGGRVVLRVNGKVDASSGVDMATQVGSAYFPRFFKPDAKEVMVIGFGSGCTPGRSLEFPGANVVCCEIEPAVYAAAEHFGSVNSKPYEKTREWLEANNAKLPADKRLTPEQIAAEARFSMIFGDGRTAIQGSGKKYDLIISEPSNPWLAGVSNLFTREFFRSTREHLNEGGVLAQWIQAYNFTLADYLMIVRTMQSEFPHYGVVILAGGVDTLLLASNKPLLPDAKQIAELQKLVDGNRVIRNDMQNWFGGTDLRWVMLANYILGQGQLDNLLSRDQSKDLNTDLHLRLEFDAPLHLFRPLSAGQMAAEALPAASEDRWVKQLAESLDIKEPLPDVLVHIGDCAMEQAAVYSSLLKSVQPTFLDKARLWYLRALAIDPQHALAQRNLKKVQIRLDKKLNETEALMQVLAADPNDAVAHAELATIHLRESRRKEAIQEFRQALGIEPDVTRHAASYSWANNYAWLLATSPEAELRNGPEAVRWAQTACDFVGNESAVLLDTLGAALAEAGKFSEAIEVTNQMTKVANNNQELLDMAASRRKLYEASQPFREK